MTIKITREAFQCQNCEKLWAESECEWLLRRKPKEVFERFQRGDTFTDLECPECGALCYSIGEERF